ncbi:MAG: hypothetical protein CMN28_08685 [Salinisphaeraceae bacterium]|nr:hypothetical protein [Salinisphaeraceae bacterium]
MVDFHKSWSGQLHAVATLMDEMQALGHHVVLACRSDSLFVEMGRQRGWNVWPALYLIGGFRPRKRLADLFRLCRYIVRNDFDLIHVNGSQDHWLAAFAIRLTRRKMALVRTRHNTKKVANTWSNRLLNQRWTDLQITACELLIKDYQNHPAFLKKTLVSIHQGVYLDRTRTDAAHRSRLRASLGFSESDCVLGISARVHPDKGHRYLLDAMAALNRPDLKLLVIGDGPGLQIMQAYAADIGVASRVHFAGYVDDVGTLLQIVDIGIQPSVGIETSCLAIKEIMALQKPVIVSDYGGLPEIVNHEVEGLVVSHGSAQALARAIGRLADDRHAAAMMGRAGRRRVEDQFTARLCAIRTLNAYRLALTQIRPPNNRLPGGPGELLAASRLPTTAE